MEVPRSGGLAVALRDRFGRFLGSPALASDAEPDGRPAPVSEIIAPAEALRRPEQAFAAQQAEHSAIGRALRAAHGAAGAHRSRTGWQSTITGFRYGSPSTCR